MILVNIIGKLSGGLFALAIDPEHRAANEYLGQLLLEVGRLNKAKERLAVLDESCFFTCNEYTSLKKAIEKYSR